MLRSRRRATPTGSSRVWRSSPLSPWSPSLVPSARGDPSPIAAADPGLFRPVEVLSLTRGTVTTVQPPDPGARSAGTLDERSMFIEPATRTEPQAAPVRDAQPAPEGGVDRDPPADSEADAGAERRRSRRRRRRRRSKSTAASDDSTRRTSGWRFDSERVLVWTGVLWPRHRVWPGTHARADRRGSQDPAVRDEDRCSGTPRTARPCSSPVVDRGPYVSGRSWDLTGGALLALGPLLHRLHPVEVRRRLTVTR